MRCKQPRQVRDRLSAAAQEEKNEEHRDWNADEP